MGRILSNLEMKIGVLGDIHANLSALERVLQCIDAEGVELLVSVGDVVGYGAAPSQCIELLASRDAVVVKGNHDAACIGELDELTFNPYARAAVEWTRGVLSAGEFDWLRALPLTATLEHCQVAHGTLYRPELFDYILSSTDADPSLEILQRPVCFVGHSHVPLTVLRLADAPDRSAYTFDPEIALADTVKALVNVGSVGQPRDEDPRTAYAIYDSDTRLIRIHRVEYDIAAEAERIRRAGLPPVLADRLSLGV
jgi:diadenosine tetraphosphatase ApaH/serine/threonine PP2A family protein phosphatase